MSETKNKPSWADIAVKNLDNLNPKQKEIIHLPTEEEKKKIEEDDPGAHAKENATQEQAFKTKIPLDEFPLPERAQLPPQQANPLPSVSINKVESPKVSQSSKKIDLPQQEQPVPLHSQKQQQELNALKQSQEVPKEKELKSEHLEQKQELPRVEVSKEEQPLSEKNQPEHPTQQKVQIFPEQKFQPQDLEKKQPNAPTKDPSENKGLLEKAKETLGETWEVTKEVAKEFTEIIGFTGPEDTKSGLPLHPHPHVSTEVKTKSREIPLHKLESKVEHEEKRE